MSTGSAPLHKQPPVPDSGCARPSSLTSPGTTCPPRRHLLPVPATPPVLAEGVRAQADLRQAGHPPSVRPTIRFVWSLVIADDPLGWSMATRALVGFLAAATFLALLSLTFLWVRHAPDLKPTTERLVGLVAVAVMFVCFALFIMAVSNGNGSYGD